MISETFPLQGHRCTGLQVTTVNILSTTGSCHSSLGHELLSHESQIKAAGGLLSKLRSYKVFKMSRKFIFCWLSFLLCCSWYRVKIVFLIQVGQWLHLMALIHTFWLTFPLSYKVQNQLFTCFIYKDKQNELSFHVQVFYFGLSTGLGHEFLAFIHAVKSIY